MLFHLDLRVDLVEPRWSTLDLLMDLLLLIVLVLVILILSLASADVSIDRGLVLFDLLVLWLLNATLRWLLDLRLLLDPVLFVLLALISLYEVGLLIVHEQRIDIILIRNRVLNVL